MKDGRTALAYKAEHAVDMETGAIVGVTAHGGATGDTESVQQTLPAAGAAVGEQIATPTAEGEFVVNADGVEEVVADKGYHSGEVLAEMQAMEVRPTLRSRSGDGGNGRARKSKRRRSTAIGSG